MLLAKGAHMPIEGNGAICACVRAHVHAHARPMHTHAHTRTHTHTHTHTYTHTCTHARTQPNKQALTQTHGYAPWLTPPYPQIKVDQVTNWCWVAPEARSSFELTQASDVYSFGIIMYELLTWRMPFDYLVRDCDKHVRRLWEGGGWAHTHTHTCSLAQQWNRTTYPALSRAFLQRPRTVAPAVAPFQRLNEILAIRLGLPEDSSDELGRLPSTPRVGLGDVKLPGGASDPHVQGYIKLMEVGRPLVP